MTWGERAMQRLALLGRRIAAAPAAVASDVAPAAALPSLELRHGGVRQRFTAADGRVTIGRGKRCNVVIGHKQVSRLHATIVWEDGGEPLLVNQSRSGTCVRAEGRGEGLAVPESLRLEGSGEIALGDDYDAAAGGGATVAFRVTGATPPTR